MKKLLCFACLLLCVLGVRAISSASITSYSDAACSCCNTGSATVTANDGSGSYSYQWSSGGSSSYEYNLYPGYYSVTVTDLGDNTTATASIYIGPGLAVNTGNMSTVNCSGYTADVPVNACGAFAPGNVFTAWLSDQNGSFASPVAIGTLSSTGSGTITATIPTNTTAGTGYRVRVDASDPATTGSDNGNDLVISPNNVDVTSITGSSFCAGSYLDITFVPRCNFNTGNVFTAQLSNAAGSFASPVNIGTLYHPYNGTVRGVIPPNTPTGNGYRVRVVASSPVATGGADNGADLIITQSAPAITTSAIPAMCTGGIGLPYTICGKFNAGNVFTAQLSDANGSFASPLAIGSNADTTGGTIDAVVPGGLPAGTGYRIRVVSSLPPVTGADNGTNLVIDGTPAAQVWQRAQSIPGNMYSGDAPNMDGNQSSIAADKLGNTYVVASYEGLAQFGSQVHLSAGGYDGYLVKYDSTGKVVWVNTLEGTANDLAKAVTVNAWGDICVTGYFESDTLNIRGLKLVHNGGAPSAAASINRTGRSAVFVAVFGADGAVKWVRKGGGNYTTGNYDNVPSDRAYGITTDNLGNIFITGSLSSDTALFDHLSPVISPPYTGTLGKVFAAKYSPAGTIQWVKTVPVAGYGRGAGIACDQHGSAFITGVMVGNFTFAAKTYNTSAWDAFICKYDSVGNELWAGNGGSPPDDAARAITVDNSGNAYITGWTQSYPLTFGQVTIPDSSRAGIFLVKYDGASGNVLWAKRAGSKSFDQGYSLTTDNCGNIYMAGVVGTRGTIARFDTITLPPVDYNDAFVAMFGPDGKAKFARSAGNATSPYYGWNAAYGIALDANNDIICTGYFGGQDIDFGCLPVKPKGLNGNIFVAKIDNALAVPGANIDITGKLALCAGDSTVLTASGGGNYTWSPAQGLNTTAGNIVIAKPASTTAYQVAYSNGGCISSKTAVVQVNELPVPVVSISDSLLCSGDSARVCVDGTFENYVWNNAATSNCIEAKQAGGYWVSVTDGNGCQASSQHLQLAVYPAPSVAVIIKGDTLTSFGAQAYQWYYNGAAISGATQPVYIAQQTGEYAVEITDANGCTIMSNQFFVEHFVIGIGINDIAAGGLLVYPNPASGYIYIRSTTGIPVEGITLYDVLGRELMDEKWNGNEALDITLLPSGSYFLKVKAGEQLHVVKLNKQ